jgi:ribosomal protein L19E
MTAKKTEPVAIDLSEFRRKPVAGCGFARLVIEPDHIDKLKGAMQADDISNESIQEWLKARGYSISEEMVRKHRNGKCRCLPTT